MHFFLFFIYLSCCIYIIVNNNFFKESSLSKKELLFLFTIKIIAGFAYAYYFSLPSQIANSDTWLYFNESIVETDKLLHHPKLFISELWYNQYTNNIGLFTGVNSYWNDLKPTVFVKAIGLFNILSFKNYYINLLFFNLFVFFGTVALYKLINQLFIIKKWILIITIFLLPSFLFWNSGLHKDGIIFSCLALILYYFNLLLTQTISFKKIMTIVFYTAIIFLLRNYALLALFPALAAWYFSTKLKQKPIFIFTTSILFCLTLFFFSSSFKITKPIGDSIVQKHQEFQQLEGNSKIITPILENSSTSLLQYFPFALKTMIVQPIPTKSNGIAQNLTSIENYLYLVLALVSMFFITKQKINSPLLLSLLSITFLLYLFIGYTVCFSGAIVRYRSITLPFTILPLIIFIFAREKETKLT